MSADTDLLLTKGSILIRMDPLVRSKSVSADTGVTLIPWSCLVNQYHSGIDPVEINRPLYGTNTTQQRLHNDGSSGRNPAKLTNPRQTGQHQS